MLSHLVMKSTLFIQNSANIFDHIYNNVLLLAGWYPRSHECVYRQVLCEGVPAGELSAAHLAGVARPPRRRAAGQVVLQPGRQHKPPPAVLTCTTLC